MINADPHPAWEYNALRWIERVGFDVTYCTSLDTEVGWPAGKATKAFLSVGHDEYWSVNMRQNVTAKRDAGVNLAFMGANICDWKIQFATGSPSGLRSFSCGKTPSEQWRYTEHEATLIGVEYVDNSYNTNMTVTNPSGAGHWSFYLTGISPGNSLVLTGLLGYEVDGCWLSRVCQGTGGTALCPGTAPSPNSTILASTVFLLCADGPDPDTSPDEGRSYMTIYTATSGAQVWATGSMFWNWGLDDFGYKDIMVIEPHWNTGSRANNVAKQMTRNVLRKLSGISTQSAVPLP